MWKSELPCPPKNELSVGKIGVYFLHSGHLIHMEGTATITVSTSVASVGVQNKMFVMVNGKFISCTGQVVVFVDKTHVKAAGTGLAVIAIHTPAIHIFWRQRTDERIISFFRRSIKKTEYVLQLHTIPYAWQNGEYARFIQHILYALIGSKCPAERRCFIL